MHIYLMTRGVKHDVDRFINELSAKYLPTKWQKKGEEKPMDYQIQVGVRPIQLWEVIFPREHKDLMLNTIFKSGAGETQHKKHNKIIWALRKALGVDPIPKDYKRDAFVPLYNSNIESVGIGIKDDYFFDNGVEAL